MQFNAEEQQQIREYLLGQLPSEQQPQFEERLLADEDFYEELLIAEDELVDEYLRDEMRQRDRSSFESHFLASSEHQEKIRFARTLKKYVAAESNRAEPVTDADSKKKRESRFFLFGLFPSRSPVLGYALAAAAVLIVVGIGWWAAKNIWNPNPRHPGNVLSVILTPGLTRGEGDSTNRVTIAPNTDTLRLELLLPDNRYQFYEASLIDSAGHSVVNKNSLKSQSVNGQQAVVLDIESRLVPAGDYRVKLEGASANGSIESVASYSFRIQNK